MCSDIIISEIYKTLCADDVSRSPIGSSNMQSTLKWWARVRPDPPQHSGLDAMMVRRKAALARLGLQWPPPKAEVGRPTRQAKYIAELYGHARRGELDILDMVENTEPPVWWKPGAPAGMCPELAERRSAQLLSAPKAASDDDTEEAPEADTGRKRRKKVHTDPVAISWFLDFQAHMKKARSWTSKDCWAFATRI